MARKAWTFQVDGEGHTLVLEHGYLSGKRRIWLDGEELDLKPSEARRLLGSRLSLPIGNHELILDIRTNGITYTYDLGLDGISVTSGEELPLEPPTFSTFSRSDAKSFSTGLMVSLLVLGFGAIAANWYIVSRSGTYYPVLSFIGPTMLLLGGYIALATEPDGSVREMGIRDALILLGLNIILGILVNYLLSGNLF